MFMLRGANRQRPEGHIVLWVLILLSSLLIFQSLMLSLTIIQHRTVRLQYQQTQCLILAESGLHQGLRTLRQTPAWHTDNDYNGPTADRKTWILQTAHGSIVNTSQGTVKIVKEATHPRLFSVGTLGASPQSIAARRVLELALQWENGQWKRGAWQRL
jgi:Tfp pilus assembly protein PilX